MVGAGTVGASIARFLSKEGHEVVIVDIHRAKLSSVDDQLDVQTFAGNACDPGVLRQLEVDRADLLLAVTERDETNLVSCFAAKQLGCRRTIARVRSRFYYEAGQVNFREPLGIDSLISPEILTAHEMLNFVSVPGALASASLAQGRVRLHSVRVSPSGRFARKAVKELGLPAGVLIAGLRRGSEVLIARGETVLRAEDRVTLIGLPDLVAEVAAEIASVSAKETPRSVGIAGAGETGLELALLLEERKHRVTIIERDLARAQFAGERLRTARVLHGDATDVNLLREEGIGSLDFFIGTTGDDESNIMAALLAKDLGVPKLACLIDRPDYTGIVERIGIDVAVSPRFVVANRVLAMIKRGTIRSVTLLEDGELEIVEYQVQAGSLIVGQALRDVELPPGILIGAVVSSNEVLIPRGDTIIGPGSIVIAVARADDADKLEGLFAPAQAKR